MILKWYLKKELHNKKEVGLKRGLFFDICIVRKCPYAYRLTRKVLSFLYNIYMGSYVEKS